MIGIKTEKGTYWVDALDVTLISPDRDGCLVLLRGREYSVRLPVSAHDLGFAVNEARGRDTMEWVFEGDADES